MKNNIKYCAVGSGFLLLLLTASINCAENKIIIKNDTTTDLSIALVTTKNFNHDMLFQDGPAIVHQLGSGFLRPLKAKSWIKIDNLPKADKKYAMTKYDRTLWISQNPNFLDSAIQNGKIADKNKVQFGEVGSKPVVTIVASGKTYKIDTSTGASRRADVEKNEVQEIEVKYLSKKNK